MIRQTEVARKRNAPIGTTAVRHQWIEAAMLTKMEIQDRLDGWLRELERICGIPYDERVSSFLAERLASSNVSFEDWDVTSLRNGQAVRVTGQRGAMIRYESVERASTFGFAMGGEFDDSAKLTAILNRLQTVRRT